MTFHLTESAHREFVEKFAAGATIAALAKEAGCCVTTMQKWLRTAGIVTKRPRVYALAPEHLEALRTRQTTARELAKQLGVAYTHVRKAGGQYVRRGARPISQKTFLARVEAKYPGLFEAAMQSTLQEVSDRYGVSRAYVQQICKRAGVVRPKYQHRAGWQERVDLARAEIDSASPTAIKTKYGLSPQTVRGLIAASGGSKYKHVHPTPAADKLVASGLAGTMPDTAVAERLGISAHRVITWRKRHGVQAYRWRNRANTSPLPEES